MKKNTRFIALVAAFIMALLLCLPAMAQDSRPRLGVSVTPLRASPLLLQHLRLSEGEGLMVNNIVVGGALEQSGLSQGDILLAVNGHSMSSPEDLHRYISSLPKNEPVTLDVIQKGEHRQIDMRLDDLPDDHVWKYAQPVMRSGRSAFRPGSFSFGRNMSPAQGGGASSSSRMMFRSMVTTPDGMKRTVVTVEGPKGNPDSTVTVEIGADTYKSRIGDIDSLPEEARDAVSSALSQGGGFSFSFGFGDDMFEKIMRRHQDQMRMMDEFFQNQPADPPAPGGVKKDSVLKPVEPSPDDIRS